MGICARYICYDDEFQPPSTEAMGKKSLDEYSIDKAKKYLKGKIADYEGEIDVPKWPDWWDNVKRKCITLEKFFKENSIEHIDYMKVDIEGHEHTVLPSIPLEIYSKINKIFVEYHEDTTLSDEERSEKRSAFVLDMLNKGYNNYHVALGYHQSFIYLWK